MPWVLSFPPSFFRFPSFETLETEEKNEGGRGKNENSLLE
jgi:hypothetical protein